MTVEISALTEIVAINTMLAAIGEAPVSSIDGASHSDALSARDTLNTVSREVQSEGWYFNTEEDFPFIPDVNGEIKVSDSVIAIDTLHWDARLYNIDPVLRGNRMYDRRNHTYTFKQGFKATIKLFLPFEELPDAAKQYITVRAARRFQGEAVGSETLSRFTEVNEGQARAVLMREQVQDSDSNFLAAGRNSLFGRQSINRIIDRRFC